jgi:uncharacterized damage-inducible protein DinB
MDDLEKLKYPIGRFAFVENPSANERAEWIDTIQELPFELQNAVAELDDQQLDTPYREDGWSVRTVVHHLADSNIHFYCRTKFIILDDKPHVVGFDENEWLTTPDYTLPLDSALELLEGLHFRWVTLFMSLEQEQFRRKYVHPTRGEEPLDYILQYSAWHGRHHASHITELRKRKNW